MVLCHDSPSKLTHTCQSVSVLHLSSPVPPPPPVASFKYIQMMLQDPLWGHRPRCAAHATSDLPEYGEEVPTFLQRVIGAF